MTLANIILSILHTKDKKFIEHKLDNLENQLTLNQVEQRIIKEIRENLYMDDIITPEYIKTKYKYYAVDEDSMIPEAPLTRDAIDSSITQIRIGQLRKSLSKDVLKLSSQISTLSPKELKEEISKLHTNVLVESKFEVPETSLVEKVDAYGDTQISRGGLSLVLPDVEHHTGKATKGTTVALLAAPGHYKTAYALNIAYTNALEGNNMLYLTLEDTASKLTSRLVLNHISRTAKKSEELIDANKLRDGKLTKAKQKVYNEKHNDMIKTLDDHLLIWDNSQFEYDTFMDMESTLRMADKEFKKKTGKGLDAIFVDHVSLLKYTSGSGKRYGYDGAVINDWVLFFNNQALNFLDEGRQITFFPLSQVKRDAFAEASKPRKKGRYELDCAADASEIERISTSMVTLYKDYETQGTLLINIPKAREGFVPENPIQEEVYGEYFHIGPLNNIYSGSDNDITADIFDDDKDLELSDLIKKD